MERYKKIVEIVKKINGGKIEERRHEIASHKVGNTDN